MGDVQSHKKLFSEVRQLIDESKRRASAVGDAELSLLYWQLRYRIKLEILQGQHAEYGKQVIASLAQELTIGYGRGWSERQLRYYLRLAESFPDIQIMHALGAELSWSHLR